MLKKINSFFRENVAESIIVGLILVLASVIRFWRIDVLLGFYYDQGRDALVIWDLVHKGKLFLIGPTTGIAGIFRGPFYYYLIAPFYWLGKGDPLWPEIFLIITSIIALGLMYFLARKIGGISAGVMTLILGTFSFEIIYASRWLSNPTPMLILSMIILWMVFLVYEGKKWAWIALSFVLGMSFFSFGSSGELFYFPAIVIFAIWRFFFTKDGTKNIPNIKTVALSVAAFFLSYLPLLAFNLKHGGLLSGNVQSFIFSGKNFGIGSAKFVSDRLSQMIGYSAGLLFHQPYEKEWLWLVVLGIILLYFLSAIIKNEKLKIVLLFLLCPTIGLLFFQGNYGNIYGYYLTGYYLIFLIFVGVSLSYVFWRSMLGKIFVVIFLVTFLNKNWFWTKGMLNTKISDSTIIVLGNQKQAISWIYSNARSRKFNVDVYVPPVIPYAYDYLFTWMPNSNKVEGQVPLLYTLYEIDPDHPARLGSWLERQGGIGKVLRQERFGGIIVQERERVVQK